MTQAVDSRIDWTRLAGPGPVAGVVAATVHGAQLSAALYTLEPGTIVPEHTHPNEEFGQVIAGSVTVEHGGSSEEFAAGEAFLIPGDEPHAATAGAEGCTLLECYAPPRAPREER